MATLTKRTEALETEVHRIDNDVQKINHTLEGNGSIGIYDQLKKIGKDQGELRKEFHHMREEMKEDRTKNKHRMTLLTIFIIITPFYSNIDLLKNLVVAVLK